MLFASSATILETMSNREYIFYVYILASRSRDLYVGLTNNIIARVSQHRELPPNTYTARYNITRLVHYERFAYVRNAIAREKELKDWNRQRKIASSSKPIQHGKTSQQTGRYFDRCHSCLAFKVVVIPQRSGGICCSRRTTADTINNHGENLERDIKIRPLNAYGMAPL